MTNFYDNFIKEKWEIDEINQYVKEDCVKFIREVESEFYEQIKYVVDCFLKNKKHRFMMISGPSSSGKTTVANMIRKELLIRKIESESISLDDFYVGIVDLPVLSDGSRDFESIEGLDILEIKTCLNNLLKKGYCDMPTYDFSVMSRSDKRRSLKVKDNDIIIVEGLHAINPIISESLPKESIFKVYVGVKSKIYDNKSKVISQKGIRLVRRVLRDYNYRSTLPIRTILMWKNVCRGEDLYIKPLRKESDIFVNTFHGYEEGIMAKKMLELMGSIPESIKLSNFLKDLSIGLSKFEHIDKNLVPEESLLREFICLDS